MIKRIILSFAVTALLASCASTPNPTGTHIAGHPYRTKSDCVRTQPIGKFDPKCDEPLLGFNDFSPMSFPVTTGGGGASGPSF